MKNILLPIYLVAAALCCGCNGKRETTTREYVPNNPELINRINNVVASSHEPQRGSQQKELPSDSILIRYFYSLANSADQRYPWEEVFSTELAMLQKHSDAVPDVVFIVSEPTFGGLGYAGEEWFSTLCQCSIDTDSVPVTSISKFSTEKDSVLAIIDYDCYEKASCHKQGSGTLEMKLVLENGRWVVCDYGEQSSHKSKLEGYIKTQREYFRSEKWKSDVEENLSGTSREQALSAVDEYFRKYPD